MIFKGTNSLLEIFHRVLLLNRYKHVQSGVCYFQKYRYRHVHLGLTRATLVCVVAGNSNLERRWYKRYPESLDDPVLFDQISEETLQSLTEVFDEVLERPGIPKDSDVSLSDGVITLYLGPNIGTYVINKQGPNRQIWLSSPISGPKRYDFASGTWLYRHDGRSLHQLLTQEIGDILKVQVDFQKCSYGST